MRPVRHVLVLLAVLVGAETALAQSTAPANPMATPFSESDLLNGKRTTEAECTAATSAVWVTASGSSECIHYYHSAVGAPAAAKSEVIVSLSGDLVSANARGEIKPFAFYAKSSPAAIQGGSDSFSRTLRLPYLMLGRPGTYGSSGSHAKRRTPQEIELISAALDAIRARHSYSRIHLFGFAEAAQAAAALLPRRTDLGCVVLGSPLVALGARQIERGEKEDVTRNKDVIDPITVVAKIAKRPDLRIFVLTDPDDIVISARSQTTYVRRATAAALPITQIFAEAPDPYGHELWRQGRQMLADCVRGMETKEIVEKYQNKVPAVAPDAEDRPLHNTETLTQGVTVSEAKCAAMPSAVWVKVEGRGFCVRYFMSNAGGQKDAALVFFNGDIGSIDRGKASFAGSSETETAGALQRDARVWSRIYGGPYLEIGRLGTLGSTGHHPRERRTALEVKVEAAALDLLKERFGFKRLHLVGQSGGGHNVAALAETRTDLGCVVSASGVLSVRLRAKERGGAVAPGALDPVDSVAKLRDRPEQRMIVLSDPDDRVVSFSSQTDFVQKAKASGVQVLHITAGANDEKFHGLSSVGRRVAIDCAEGKDDAALIAKFQAKASADPKTTAKVRSTN